MNFDEGVERIVRQGSDYSADAYYFVKDALTYTQEKLSRNRKRKSSRHVSGREFSEGVRQYVLEEFGPLGFFVLAEWGIHSCEDLGEIVFELVQAELLTKTDQDSREDFAGVFDFWEALVHPYLPPSQRSRMKNRSESDAAKRRQSARKGCRRQING